MVAWEKIGEVLLDNLYYNGKALKSCFAGYPRYSLMTPCSAMGNEYVIHSRDDVVPTVPWREDTIPCHAPLANTRKEFS